MLITSQWPKGVDKSEDDKSNTSPLISWLSTQIRPRYHFCGISRKHYEHAPFRTAATDLTQLVLSTRFIALADLANTEKLKHIYALNITPVDKMKVMDLIQKTTDEAASPYEGMSFVNIAPKRLVQDSNQYFYDMNSYGGDSRGRKRGGDHNQHHHNKRPPRPDFDPEKCWFCLSSPAVEKHLVVSIGDSFYLALAKGPLNETHCLIISVTHIQSASLLSKDDFDELVRFKDALRKYFKSKGQVASFFERNYKAAHLQVNAIAVDESLEWQLKNTVADKSDEYNIQFETVPSITEPTQLPPQGAYFTVEIADGTTYLTRQMKQFPLHFGRDIFCAETLLNCEDKVDWRQCSLQRDEEEQLVKQFREGFKPFDFTI